MRTTRIFFAALIAFSAWVSCTTVYQPQSVQYNDYRISANARQDSNLVALLRPYADSVNRSMNAIVAVTAMELEKRQPEGTLGNVMADAMLVMGASHFKTKVDAAFVNYGGIRLTSIPAGNITRGKVFELAPFDNVTVLQRLSGTVLQQFLDHISGRGGWPCSGITWQIKDKKAINVLIGGKPLDPAATYTIANNDYVANGGDDCAMLRNIPQQNDGYVYRDAVLEYFAGFSRQGKKISAQIENRVTNVN